MKKYSTMLAALLLAFTQNAMAVLPTAVAPSNGAAATDWLALITGYIKDGGLLIGLAISVAGFLWLSWIIISDVNKCRAGDKEWGELGVTAIIGAVGLMFVTYLLAQASGVI
jgi:integrating conjugative element membrane protein (TIGR03745 family)